jgi:hypothetical protein
MSKVIDGGGKKTELELRAEWHTEAKAMTMEKLPAFIEKLGNYPGDYGTCCVAIGAAAVATANAMNRAPVACGGITGFQAGAVCWEFIRGWGAFGGEDSILQIFDWEHVLYPQYDGKTITIKRATWERLQELARKNIEKAGEYAHSAVVQRWKDVAAGHVPPPFVLEPDAMLRARGVKA